MVLSGMVKSAIHLEQCRALLQTKGINLKKIAGYQLLSSDIVAHLCWILSNYCLMENVDSGSVGEYFDTRFADTRNRAAYVPE